MLRGGFSWSEGLSHGTGGGTLRPYGPHVGAKAAATSLHTLSLFPLQEGRKNEVLLSKVKAKSS